MPLGEYHAGTWNVGSISMQAIGKKGRITYRLKRFTNPPWPAGGDMRDARVQEQAKRCESLLEKRKVMNERLKKADARSRSIAYADDVFLSTDTEAPGVIEAVREVSGLCDADWLRGDGDRLLSALLSCTRAVERLHAAGIVHGDIKPENILFVKSSSAAVRSVLIDFDRSYPVDEIPGPEEIGGSRGYMAPEVQAYFNDEDCEEDGSDSRFRADLSEKRDIFSLGVVFYVLLTGEALLWRDNEPDLSRVRERSGLNADWLEPLLFAMLDMEPGARPDADQVAQTLQTNRLAFTALNFEELWPEHAESFSYAANLSRYARIRRREAEGMRQYMVYYREGGDRLYTIQMLYNVGIVVKGHPQPVAARPVEAVEAGAGDAEELWPEHAGYEIDQEMLTRSGYTRLTRGGDDEAHWYIAHSPLEGDIPRSFAALLWEGCLREKR